jgi:hypothetical protein
VRFRIDVHHHSECGLHAKLQEILELLQTLNAKEIKLALDISTLTAEVTRQGTIADSVIAWIQGHAGEPGIDQPTIDALVASIRANNDRLNVAIPANTPPPTP